MASKQSEIENHDDVQPSRISFTPQKYWISYHFVQKVCLRCSYTFIVVTVVPGWWKELFALTLITFIPERMWRLINCIICFQVSGFVYVITFFNDFLLENIRNQFILFMYHLLLVIYQTSVIFCSLCLGSHNINTMQYMPSTFMNSANTTTNCSVIRLTFIHDMHWISFCLGIG